MRRLLSVSGLGVLVLGGFVAGAGPAVARTTGPGAPDSTVAAPASLVAAPASLVAGAGRAVATTSRGPIAAVAAPGTLYATAAVSATDEWAVGNSGASALAERWNGHAWARVHVPDPQGTTSSTLYGVAAVSANDVWAVGYSTSGSGKAMRESGLTEHWNGRAWAVVSSPDPGAPKCPYTILFAVTAASAGRVWASGYACAGATQAVGALVEHWNGHRWANAGAPATSGSMLLALTVVSAGDVWAAGSASLRSGVEAPLIEHWNGRAWTRVASPGLGGNTMSSLNSLAAGSAGDVWAVGTAQTEKVGRTLVEHWNGRVWRRIPSPNPGGAPTASFAELYGVAAVSAHDVWAAGDRSSTKGINTLIEHWNGHAWTRVASPNGGWGGALASVAAVGANDVWATGQTLAQTLRPTPLAEHWTGHGWHQVTVGGHP